MSFKPSNQLWKLRKNPYAGRPRFYEDPESLWKDAEKYFKWVEENPLIEMKPFAFQGVVTQEPIAKMRPMTIKGLCIHLGISPDAWEKWRKDEKLKDVVQQIDMVIWEQKFTGAAADLMNPVIISREIGLIEKQHHTLNTSGDETKMFGDLYGNTEPES